MKHLTILLVIAITILIGLAACSDGGGTLGEVPEDKLEDSPLDVFQEELLEGGTPSAAALEVVLLDEELSGEPIKPESVEITELSNDGTYATVRVYAQRRLGPESDWLNQYADIDLVKTAGSGWEISDDGVYWQNTVEQEASIQAKETVSVQATQTAEEEESLKAIQMIDVDFPNVHNLKFTGSRVYLDIVIVNNDDVNHSIVLRTKFRFPEGEVYQFKDKQLGARASSSQTRGIYINKSGIQLPDKYLRDSDPVTGEVFVEDPIVSLAQWQIVVDGKEREIHTVGK